MSFESTATSIGKAAGISARLPGPVDNVRSALESAERLAERIETLSRRLVGSVPGADIAVEGTVSDGLFYEMSDHASRVMNLISDAESAISRIERALP